MCKFMTMAFKYLKKMMSDYFCTFMVLFSIGPILIWLINLIQKGSKKSAKSRSSMN